MKFLKGHYRRGILREPDAARFWRKVDKSAGPDACWPFIASIDEHGYGRFHIGNRLIHASRAAFMFANDGVPSNRVVRHTCDNPICCNPSHLILGTHADNSADMSARGRNAKGAAKSAQMFAAGFYGENCAHSTIPANTVSAMRELFSTGKYRQTDLATMFGVSKSQTMRIVRGKARVHG